MYAQKLCGNINKKIVEMLMTSDLNIGYQKICHRIEKCGGRDFRNQSYNQLIRTLVGTKPTDDLH